MVMSTVDRYIFSRLGLAALLATLGLSGPIILVTLINQVPLIAISGRLFWPALYGIGCMILFHTLPILVAGAIVWVYGQFMAEGVIVTLYMAGRSTFAVRLPAILVSLVAVAGGYLLSLHFAPDSAKYIHDILFALRRDMSPDLLEAGKFNEFGQGGQVIFFERKVGNNQIAQIFIRQVENNPANGETTERVYTAEQGVFGGTQGDRWVALVKGSVIIARQRASDVRKVEFRELVWRPLVGYGEGAVRGYRIYDELNTSDFVAKRQAALAAPKLAREWAKEAVKRFCIPLLALVHTLFGLELLALFGSMTDRRGYQTSLLNGILLAVHVIVVLLAEIVGQVGFSLVWLVLALILLEAGSTLALMNPALRRRVQTMLDNSTLPRLALFVRLEQLLAGKPTRSETS